MFARCWSILRDLRTACCIACAFLVACSGRHPPDTPVPLDRWNPQTGMFRWSRGEVTLPRGLRYQGHHDGDHGATFTSEDWSLNIHCIIRGCPGADAWGPKENLEEKVVEGARVWVSRGDWRSRGGSHKVLGVVTFPDSECASFMVDSTKSEDAAVIDAMVRSFHPRSPADSRSNVH